MICKRGKSNWYYYHNIKINGRVHTFYLGRGPEAEAFAAGRARERGRWSLARLRLRERIEAGRRRIEAERRRIIRLGEVVERAMIAAGYYKHRGTWRRRGPITMGTVRNAENSSNIITVLQREAARRHFRSLDGDELAAEIERYAVDVAALAQEELVAGITDDPMRQEATCRRLEQVAAELAGPAPSPLVRLLSQNVAVLSLERDLATLRSRRAEPADMPFTAINKDLWKLRGFIERRLNAAIRTLAHVRRVEASAIQKTVERLRIAG
jgi:hypothetical protein